jgi:hypothetical protein
MKHKVGDIVATEYNTVGKVINTTLPNELEVLPLGSQAADGADYCNDKLCRTATKQDVIKWFDIDNKAYEEESVFNYIEQFED